MGFPMLEFCTLGMQLNLWYFTFQIQTLEDDVEGYVTVVEGLESEAKRLTSADHFDSANITARQVSI